MKCRVFSVPRQEAEGLLRFSGVVLNSPDSANDSNSHRSWRHVCKWGQPRNHFWKTRFSTRVSWLGKKLSLAVVYQPMVDSLEGLNMQPLVSSQKNRKQLVGQPVQISLPATGLGTAFIQASSHHVSENILPRIQPVPCRPWRKSCSRFAYPSLYQTRRDTTCSDNSQAGTARAPGAGDLDNALLQGAVNSLSFRRESRNNHEECKNAKIRGFLSSIPPPYQSYSAWTLRYSSLRFSDNFTMLLVSKSWVLLALLSRLTNADRLDKFDEPKDCSVKSIHDCIEPVARGSATFEFKPLFPDDATFVFVFDVQDKKELDEDAFAQGETQVPDAKIAYWLEYTDEELTASDRRETYMAF